VYLYQPSLSLSLCCDAADPDLVDYNHPFLEL
jgi:hypothetical protein